jgi:hypothetical protein
VVLANLGSKSKTCVGSRVHLVRASMSFEKNLYRLSFNPPSLVRRFGPLETTVYLAQGPLSLIRCVWVPLIWDPDTWRDM